MKWIIAGLFLLLNVAALNAQRALAKADQHFEVCEYQQALDYYQVALEKAEQDKNIIAHIAMCHEAMGDNLLAVQWYEKIIDQEDIDPEYLLRYAQLLKRLNLQGKAKFYFLKYAQYAPEDGKHFAASCDFARAEQKIQSEYDVEITEFNSEHADFSPSIFNDQIVFASFRTDIVEQAFADVKQAPDLSGNQIYRTSLQGRSQSLKPLSTEVSNLSGIAPFQYAANGSRVAFTRNKWNDGNRLFQDCENMSIYLASVRPDGQWDNVTAFPHNDNSYANAYPCLSEDGTILYFASNRPGGHGGFDIWMSVRSSDTWSKPENLGPAINSPGNEITPFLIGRNLFFASDYHTGFGGFDIFKAMSDHGHWSQVFHLGAGINSERDDFGYVCTDSDGVGYFVSDRVSGRGKADIYRAIPAFREVMVKVMEQGTDLAVADASIRFADSERDILTNSYGKAIIHQPLEIEKEIIVSKEGYQDLKMRIVDGHGDVKPREYAIYLQKMTDKMLAMAEAEKAKTENARVNEPPSDQPDDAIALGLQTEAPTPHSPTDKPDQVRQTANDYQPAQNVPVNDSRENVQPAMEMSDQFAIQVAALSTANVDMSRYDRLKMYGNIVATEEGKMTKLRVGYFSSRPEAVQKLGRIRDAGYSDAFLVVVSGKSIMKDEKRKQHEVVQQDVQYKVRLATYADPGNFDPSGVIGLGEIQSYTRDDLTIMLLSGFSNKAEADHARNIANANGFPDAYVVIDEGGILLRAK